MFENLSKEHKKFKHLSTDRYIRVYRGQVISTDEFDRMHKSIGEFISINSFFSTSRNRKQALVFTNTTIPIDGLRQILFDIQVDIRLSTKPFADVSKLSYFQEEEEIIFMLGSIFRITNVYYSKDEHVWIAELILCNENDHDLRDCYFGLGNVAIEQDEYSVALDYHLKALDIKQKFLSGDDSNIASSYNQIGTAY
jgi:hypothetical protein